MQDIHCRPIPAAPLQHGPRPRESRIGPADYESELACLVMMATAISVTPVRPALASCGSTTFSRAGWVCRLAKKAKPIRSQIGAARISATSAASVRARRDGLPFRPRILAAGGDTQQPAHGGDRKFGLIFAHEPEPFDGLFVSRINQAAVFERISLSSLSWRFSRLSWWSSSCSAVVRP
jgi:hypothetical protein